MTITKHILTAHQPAYLPWLGLFHKIAIADTYVFFDQVQYVPKTWINRNYIKSENNKLLLTLPVLTKGHLDLKISDIKINNNIPWQRKHFNSIKLSYSKSKFFKKYIGFFEDIYSKDWNTLSQITSQMLLGFLSLLKIKTKILFGSDYDFKGKNNSLIIDMCKKLNANIYIFGELGIQYADKKLFKENNINICFQKYQHPTYDQLFNSFEANLSILDLLFNCGENSYDIIFENNINKKNLLRTFN